MLVANTGWRKGQQQGGALQAQERTDAAGEAQSSSAADRLQRLAGCKHLKQATQGSLPAQDANANAFGTYTPEKVSIPSGCQTAGVRSTHPTEVHAALRADHVVAPADALDARAAAGAGLGVAGHPPLINAACCLAELGHEGLPFASLQAGQSSDLAGQLWTLAGLLCRQPSYAQRCEALAVRA